jgi:hypothetical protein
MTILQMKKDDIPASTENALQAVELEPLDPAALFRLSNCHVLEKQYVSAHAAYGRAVALLPVPERTSHMTKLARLEEQANDEKKNVFRADIFSIFPLEVIMSVMEHGLLHDPLFVLRQTWVNRRWRNTLTGTAPSCGEAGPSVMRS